MIGKILVAGIVIMSVSSFIDYSKPPTAAAPPPPPLTAQEQADKKLASDQLSTAVGGAIWIKRNMKNPASFELVNAYFVQGKSYCYRYRGTNSFNAVTTQLYVINNTTMGDDEQTWKKYCTGTFEDYTGRVKISMRVGGS